ncbi:hypothetical protein BOX15_Mlig010294g1 [Macrostomum lignano]|uniref:C2H2-type domain-containing protein n=2 Tax=Macrostomum lignano TaxID=282301 RepID=A0A1I8JIC3_9PLAT|nr:hypothetical protein BOX15_Mlig025030g1 [Macrostomum lignano]PAA73063.1 hypothetical protein BOX15_Mlig010294g1 [Macrostomum lignano]
MSFPCISCGVILASSAEQREHYKSEWHRYNLKRKVANLPPIPIDEFNLKKTLFAKSDYEAHNPTGSGGEEKSKKSLPYCSACHKKFSSAKAFENHVASKKHKQREAEQLEQRETPGRSDSPDWLSVDGDSDSDSGELDGESPLGQEECLFCPNVAASLEANCAHMLREHGFALPDPDLLSDLEGLITLLDYKVGVGRECLWCHGARRFDSVRAVRSHMLDKGHCRYNLAGEHAFDLADFYDYSSLGLDPNAGEDDADSGEEDAPTDLETFELVLPSGAVVGHRSLMRYYRQSPAPSRAVALPAAGGSLQHQRLLAQYRSIGWHGPTRGQAEVATLRDRAFVQRHRQRAAVQLGLGANRLQKHFRDQNPK